MEDRDIQKKFSEIDYKFKEIEEEFEELRINSEKNAKKW
jgi:hypothetical protein